MVKEVTIRPMLAHSAPVSPDELDFKQGPYWVSPKLDGIRCMQMDGTPRSRTLKLIPNRHIQAMLNGARLDGLDGELVVGSPTHPNCIQITTSGVMSENGKPDFHYHVFDIWNLPEIGYCTRQDRLVDRVRTLRGDGLPITMLDQMLCETRDEVERAVAANYEAGYEGSIIRCYDGRYKYNRSTLKEQLLLKVKESEDSEIQVTGFVEMQHNNNEAKLDERGFTKRTTHKANKSGADTLGKLIGIDLNTGKEVTVGRGKMLASEAAHVWHHQSQYRGKIAKYRYGKHGILDAPRFPRFITWRDPIDI